MCSDNKVEKFKLIQLFICYSYSIEKKIPFCLYTIRRWRVAAGSMHERSLQVLLLRAPSPITHPLLHTYRRSSHYPSRACTLIQQHVYASSTTSNLTSTSATPSQILHDCLCGFSGNTLHSYRAYLANMSTESPLPQLQALRITLIGVGSIGISFAALYIAHSDATVTVFDLRSDVKEYLLVQLPGYLRSLSCHNSVEDLMLHRRLIIAESLDDACQDADIVQEQGPENLAFKRKIWSDVIARVRPDTKLWTSTSGITASRQVEELPEKHRLLVVHPFNPPHLMPLIELVPSPHTHKEYIDFAKMFFENLPSGHRPIVLNKEMPGFVGNRLAFVLLREAFHLVNQGVVSIRDFDTLVESSLGPRWASTGPFKSYNLGGGEGGMPHFMANLSGTMQNIWDDAGTPSLRETMFIDGEASEATDSGDWAKKLANDVLETYGSPTAVQFAERDEALQRVLQSRKD